MNLTESFFLTFLEFAKYNKGVSLTKSKSLDRGYDYPRRRKRFTDMSSIPSISLEELSLECKRPMFSKQRSLTEGMIKSIV